MDIKKKFKKFVFSLKEFNDNNIWLMSEQDVGYSYCKLYDTDDFEYPNIEGFEKISKYPYTCVLYFEFENGEMEISYYFYDKELDDFIIENEETSSYISKLENEMGLEFYNSFEYLEYIDYDDWKIIFDRTQKAFIKMNEGIIKKFKDF
jgi:hypothetical protein